MFDPFLKRKSMENFQERHERWKMENLTCRRLYEFDPIPPAIDDAREQVTVML
jgi:hypothetical protein